MNTSFQRLTLQGQTMHSAPITVSCRATIPDPPGGNWRYSQPKDIFPQVEYTIFNTDCQISDKDCHSILSNMHLATDLVQRSLKAARGTSRLASADWSPALAAVTRNAAKSLSETLGIITHSHTAFTFKGYIRHVGTFVVPVATQGEPNTKYLSRKYQTSAQLDTRHQPLIDTLEKAMCFGNELIPRHLSILEFRAAIQQHLETNNESKRTEAVITALRSIWELLPNHNLQKSPTQGTLQSNLHSYKQPIADKQPTAGKQHTAAEQPPAEPNLSITVSSGIQVGIPTASSHVTKFEIYDPSDLIERSCGHPSFPRHLPRVKLGELRIAAGLIQKYVTNHPVASEVACSAWKAAMQSLTRYSVDSIVSALGLRGKGSTHSEIIDNNWFTSTGLIDRCVEDPRRPRNLVVFGGMSDKWQKDNPSLGDDLYSKALECQTIIKDSKSKIFVDARLEVVKLLGTDRLNKYTDMLTSAAIAMCEVERFPRKVGGSN
jgi:hypothetical protein